MTYTKLFVPLLGHSDPIEVEFNVTLTWDYMDAPATVADYEIIETKPPVSDAEELELYQTIDTSTEWMADLATAAYANYDGGDE